MIGHCYFRFKTFFNLFEAHNHPLSERTLTYCPEDNYNNGVELQEAAVPSNLGTVPGQQQFTCSRSLVTSWQVSYSVPHFRVLDSRTPLTSGGTHPSAGLITGYSA
jgi:hypothetical protein